MCNIALDQKERAMAMAFREKSAWITLLTTVVVYGAYFALVGTRLFARSGESGFIVPPSASLFSSSSSCRWFSDQP
jgi:hypothetical protein